MRNRILPVILALFLALPAAVSCSGPKDRPAGPPPTRSYDDLVALYRDWRVFQKPEVRDGIADYSAAAMKAQKEGLGAFFAQLAAIDTGDWPVSQKVDREIVRAEMNGLDFDHRVLRPWSRNPCFYTVVTDAEPDVPAREGPEMQGVLEIWKYRFPLSPADLEEVRARLRAVPGVLDRARTNLVEDARDLWVLGVRVKREESAVLRSFADRMSALHPDLVPDIERARAAVDDFGAWLERKAAGMTAPSGIGIGNFDWYMKNVHLTPHTWEDQLTLVRREWQRSTAALKLEEHRNRRLPRLAPPATEEEYRRRNDEAVVRFMAFLRQEGIFTVPDYMKLDFYSGGYRPSAGVQDFFGLILDLDPLPLKCHSLHWLDKQRMAREPHPSVIRAAPLLYNIWDSRAEGLATAWEELMMQAGLFDDRPRGRELVHILIAMRAARAMGDLMMHANRFTLDEAVQEAVRETPYGWLRADGETIWTDMRIYLHQPGYGTSYLVGKVHIDKLLAERAMQTGAEFTLKGFMDEFFASGMIPVSLIRWEMTGLEDEVRGLR